MAYLMEDGIQKWNLSTTIGSSSIQAALTGLSGKLAISKCFHSELLSCISLTASKDTLISARVWSIRRPQKTTTLTVEQTKALLEKQKNKLTRGDGPNPYASGTSGISPAEQARMPEASRDRSLGTFGEEMDRQGPITPPLVFTKTVGQILGSLKVCEARTGR